MRLPLGFVTVDAQNLLLMNQRDSVWIGIGGGDRRRGLELDGDAHWVLERSEGSVVIHIGGVEGE